MRGLCETGRNVPGVQEAGQSGSEDLEDMREAAGMVLIDCVRRWVQR